VAALLRLGGRGRVAWRRLLGGRLIVLPQRSVTPPARASRLDERRDRDPREDDSGRRRNEPVHGVGDDHGPSPLRKGPLTATVGNAMLLISMYVRRILTVSRESASQTTTAR
jgi:hypothetical protein